MIESGRVVAVTLSVYGSELTADVPAGSSELTVVDAADFSEDGGVCRLVDELLTYLTVDDETGIVTLAAPTVAGALAGDRVEVWDTGAGAVAVDTVALVEVNGADANDDALEVIVEAALVPYLPEGIRGADAGEIVEVEQRGETLYLVNIVGAAPVFDGAVIAPGTLPPIEGVGSDGNPPGASPAPTVRGGIGALFVQWVPIDNADPVTYEVHVGTAAGFVTDPATLAVETAGGFAVLRTDPAGAPLDYETTYVVKVIARDEDGPAPESSEATGSPLRAGADDIAANAVTANAIAAGAITSESIAADALDGRVITGTTVRTAEAGARVELNVDGLAVYQESGEPSIRLSSTSADYVTLIDQATGEAVASISEGGAASFGQLSVDGTITFGGQDLDERIAKLGGGIVAQGVWGTAIGDTTAPKGVFEVACEMFAGRTYEVSCSPVVLNPTSAAHCKALLTYTDDGTKPTVSSPVLVEAAQYSGGADTAINLLRTVRKGTTNTLRILLVIDPYFTSGVALTTGGAHRSPVLTVRDLGPTVPDTGVANSGAGGAGAAVTVKTTTWTANSSKSYGGLGASLGSGFMRQGPAGGDGNRKSACGFNHSAIASELAGAVINRVEVYFYFGSWAQSGGGTAVIGTHNDTAVGGLPDTWGGITGLNVDRKRSADWPKPGSRWVLVDNVIGESFRDGLVKGLLLGPGPSDNELYAGEARGHDDNAPPKIRITYTK